MCPSLDSLDQSLGFTFECLRTSPSPTPFLSLALWPGLTLNSLCSLASGFHLEIHAPTLTNAFPECWGYRHGHLEWKMASGEGNTALTANPMDTELEKLQNFSKASLQIPQFRVLPQVLAPLEESRSCTCEYERAT